MVDLVFFPSGDTWGKCSCKAGVWVKFTGCDPFDNAGEDIGQNRRSEDPVGVLAAGGHKRADGVCGYLEEQVRPGLITRQVTKGGYEGSSVRLLPRGSVQIAMIGEGKTRGQTAILKSK